MKTESFEYEQVQNESEQTPLSLNTEHKRYDPNSITNRAERSCSKIINLLKIILSIIIIASLIQLAVVYSQQDRACPYNTKQECVSEYIYDKVPQILLNMLILSCSYGTIFFLTFTIRSIRKLLYLSVLAFTATIFYFHQKPDYYNYSYLYSYSLANMTIIITIVIFSLYYLILLLIWSFRRKQLTIFTLSFLILLTLALLRGMQWFEPSEYWKLGIMGKQVEDENKEGQKYCKLKIPKIDWHQVLDGQLDLTYHYLDCTKYEYNDQPNNQMILEKYIPDYKLGRYIAYPVLTYFTDSFKRSATQDYILEHIKVYKTKEEIPEEIEYVLDKETLELDIQVKRNQTIVNHREEQRRQQMNLFKEHKIQRIPPKNVFTIYIDALSRVSFMKKFPKMRQFYDEHEASNKNQYTTFQGMRAHSLASFTYHNILAYYYGAVSERQIFSHSPYSLTEGATDVEEVSEVNSNTGETKKRLKNRGTKEYSTFIQGFKDAGYITGMTSTDCATSPLTQDGIKSMPFIENIIYDHNGIQHSCDPNYFLPYIRGSQGQGPYALMRRCLYGKEVIDYSLSYAKQFMDIYKDQPKYFQLELLEAHERSQEVINYTDQKLYDFVNWLEENGHLKDSALMFISDHGYHMASLLNHYGLHEGLVQNDNGFPLQIVLIHNTILEDPDSQYLIENQQKVTTMFEIYHFLRYLITPEKSEYHRINSLASDQIPFDRDSLDLPELDALPMICFKESRHRK